MLSWTCIEKNTSDTKLSLKGKIWVASLNLSFNRSHFALMSMCDVSNNQITNKKLCIVKWQKVFFTARQRSCGKVMFSVVSVIMFRKGPHATITHDPQPPASPYRDLRGPYCTLTHLGPTTPAPEHILNLFIMKHMRLVSGQLVSYRNAFLSFSFCVYIPFASWQLVLPQYSEA